VTTPSPAVVRPATADDVPAIAAIEAGAAHQPWTASQIHDSLASPSTRGWVAVSEQAALGHLLASCVAEEGEILTLAVAPDARRRGLGRRLVGACTRHWRASGTRVGWLEVRHDNVAALGLYGETGWVEAGVRRRYYRDGADALIMRWSGSDA
jgi:[ribosomal protein S18]-alanine N-acetyltransferase